MSAIGGARPDEDVFRFIRRLRGAHDTKLYARILGAANDFKDARHEALRADPGRRQRF